jgi:hypothetical protein
MPFAPEKINYFCAKKALDISRQSCRFTAFIMKCETINSIMTFVLGAFVVLGVVFALQSMFGQRDLRRLQIEATLDNSYRMTIESIANDTIAYAEKNPNPDLLRILQAAGAKVPGH